MIFPDIISSSSDDIPWPPWPSRHLGNCASHLEIRMRPYITQRIQLRIWIYMILVNGFTMVETLGEGLAPEISIYFLYDFFMIFLWCAFMIFLWFFWALFYFMIFLWFFGGLFYFMFFFMIFVYEFRGCLCPMKNPKMHINNCWFLELDLLLKSQRNVWQHSGIGNFAAACTTPNPWKQLRVQISPLEGFDVPNLACMQIMVLVPVCDGQAFAQTRIYKISIPPLASILTSRTS